MKDLGIDIDWINHAGFLIRENGKNIYIDPYKLNGDYPKADLIFITHPHYDHLSIDDIRKVATSSTAFVIPSTAASQLPYKNVKGTAPGEAGSAAGIEYQSVPAYNNVSERLKFHPKENRWVGYIIKVSGKRVYHAGDTDLIEEMRNIDVDLALIPIGGTYTMDVEAGIKASKVIKAKIFAPMHYKALLGEAGSASAEKKFADKVANSRIMKEVQPPLYSF